MKKALSYLLIFIGIQLLGGAIIQTVWSLVTHSSDKTAAMLITLTAICAVHRRIPMGAFHRRVTQVVAHAALDGIGVERDGVVGSTHSFYMDAGTDARTAQCDGERI